MTEVQRLAEAFCASRSDASFAKLYRRLRPGLMYFVMNILKDPDAAEDVVSMAFTKIWENIGQYNPFWQFSTWSYKIAYHETMQYLRKKKKTYTLELFGSTLTGTDDSGMGVAGVIGDAVTADPDWFFDERDPNAVTAELHALALAEMNKLPAQYRQIMIDREINEMKYHEIAEKHRMKLNSVKTRILRARTIIRAKILQQQPNVKQ